jgi:hypothetical protein
LSLSTVCLHLFDELDRSVASCVVYQGESQRQATLEDLRRRPVCYAGRYTKSVNDALDVFARGLEPPEPREWSSVPLRLESWKVMKLTGIGSGEFTLNEAEGLGLDFLSHGSRRTDSRLLVCIDRSFSTGLCRLDPRATGSSPSRPSRLREVESGSRHGRSFVFPRDPRTRIAVHPTRITRRVMPALLRALLIES